MFAYLKKKKSHSEKETLRQFNFDFIVCKPSLNAMDYRKFIVSNHNQECISSQGLN